MTRLCLVGRKQRDLIARKVKLCEAALEMDL